MLHIGHFAQSVSSKNVLFEISEHTHGNKRELGEIRNILYKRRREDFRINCLEELDRMNKGHISKMIFRYVRRDKRNVHEN
jgi:ABC-type iron transport system FetAB ATPase subunit